MREEHAAIARLQAGDLAGLDAVVRAHQQPAIRLAYAIIGVRAQVEPAVVDCFATLARTIASFDPAAQIGPDTQDRFELWIFRMLVPIAIAAAHTSPSMIQSEPEPWEARGLSAASIAVQRVFSGLPAEQRAVAALQHYFQLTSDEIALVMRWPRRKLESALSQIQHALNAAARDPETASDSNGRWES